MQALESSTQEEEEATLQPSHFSFPRRLGGKYKPWWDITRPTETHVGASGTPRSRPRSEICWPRASSSSVLGLQPQTSAGRLPSAGYCFLQGDQGAVT